MDNFKPAMRWGLWMGLANIIFFVVIYAIDPTISARTGGWIMNMVVIMLAFPIFFMVLGTRDSKPNFTPFNFLRALSAAMIVGITSSLIVLVFNVVFTQVIDPGYETMLKETVMENTLEAMERRNVDEETTQIAMERTEKAFARNEGIMGKVKMTVFGWIWYLILALIVAAVQKDKKNQTDDLIA